MCINTKQPLQLDTKSSPNPTPNHNHTTKQHANWRNSEHSASHMSYVSREIDMNLR